MPNQRLYHELDYLKTQYKDSQNLGNRAQIHERFSSNPNGWFPWVFSFINLQSEYEVLECGAGPGWLWRKNLKRIQQGCHVTITDFSIGMVEEAKNSLEKFNEIFDFAVADVQNLDFSDDHFDIVIANHMLYHVPNLDKGLSEIKRVLKPYGTFIASTVGNGHMQEIRQLVIDLVPGLESIDSFYQPNFTLENGKDKLTPWFSNVEGFNYENQLHITDIDSIIAYIFSTSIISSYIDSEKLKQLVETLEESIDENGYFMVTTKSGLFTAAND